MSQRCLRQRPRISYCEIEEPNLDEYIYCDKCADLVYEYCSIHGPLLVIPDSKVPAKPDVPAYVPRAALTIPKVFLHIAPSSIPEAGLGVFATLTLPSGVRLGPYTGERSDGIDSYYSWQIYDTNRKPLYCIDAIDANKSNWMRYVNCARHWSEQNLVAFQYQGQLYYRTIKIIPHYTELLVFYGCEFANELDIDIGKYNAPCYARVYDTPVSKQNKINDEISITKQINSQKVVNYFKAVCNETENSKNIVEIRQLDTINSVNLSNSKNSGKDLVSTKISIKNCENKDNDFNGDNSKVSINTSEKINLYYHCDFCDEKFKTKYVLEKHMRFHDKNRAFACDVCTFRFISLDILSIHKSNIHEIKNTCDRTYISSAKLKTNLRTHKGEKPFACDICPAKFSQGSHLKRHLRTHTGEKSFACDICPAKFSEGGSFKMHLRTHTGEKPFACDICPAKFSEGGNLKKHLKTHTGEKPFACDICHAKFSRESNLKSHLRTHTGEKPFACDICPAKFSEGGNLKKHLRTHTGEKPFACDICPAKFSEGGSLKMHLRTHTGEKPFACDICPAKFSVGGNLKRHLRTHTREKPFACDIWHAKFSVGGNLKRHLRTHTREKPFACDIWHAKFSQGINLKKYLKTHTEEHL